MSMHGINNPTPLTVVMEDIILDYHRPQGTVQCLYILTIIIRGPSPDTGDSRASLNNCDTILLAASVLPVLKVRRVNIDR